MIINMFIYTNHISKLVSRFLGPRTPLIQAASVHRWQQCGVFHICVLPNNSNGQVSPPALYGMSVMLSLYGVMM